MPVNGLATEVVSEREPLKNEKRAREHREKIEVHCDPHPSVELILTPSQKEERQKESVRQKGERDARELEKSLKVGCGPPSNRVLI